MKIKITNWLTDETLLEVEAESVKEALEAAVKAKQVLDYASLVGASLVGASLVGASLVGARLDGASLVGARLDYASLDGASLVGARLDYASLDGASLVGASLDGASLVGASLDGASLVGARLDYASLVGASLVGARLDYASLDGASLVGARLDWNSHALIAAILWQAAEGDIQREMLAAYITYKRAWCWGQWLDFEHAEKEWALSIMRGYVKEGDNAPAILRAQAENVI